MTVSDPEPFISTNQAPDSRQSEHQDYSAPGAWLVQFSVYDMCTYTTYTMKVYVQSGAEKKYMCGQVYVRSDEKFGGIYSSVYHSEWLECIKNINKIHLESKNSVWRRLRRAKSELSTKNKILKGISKKYVQVYVQLRPEKRYMCGQVYVRFQKANIYTDLRAVRSLARTG